MRLLILGASARAAAYSALRAELSPRAIDLFADVDLAAVGPARRIDAVRYPAGLERDVAEEPQSPWIYTGGLENHPALVERIALSRPLWGNDGPALRGVRDPLLLAQVFQEYGVRCPQVRDSPVGLPRDGRWIVKPRKSAGGRGIEVWDESAGARSEPVYYQERVDGILHSAVYVANGVESALLGVSRQFAGRRDAPFVYRGSLGPLELAPTEMAEIGRVGDVVAKRFELRGLFGIDFILGEGVPWPIEVNPRYTASVEVLELATGCSFLALHRVACTEGRVEVPARLMNITRYVGKTMIFAERAFVFPDDPAEMVPPRDCWSIPLVADIPSPGTTFQVGEPIMTVLAEGETPGACEEALAARVDRTSARISAWTARMD